MSKPKDICYVDVKGKAYIAGLEWYFHREILVEDVCEFFRGLSNFLESQSKVL